MVDVIEPDAWFSHVLKALHAYEVHVLQKCQISALVLPSCLLKAMAMMMMFRTFKTDT